MPSHWRGHSLATIKAKLIDHGANIESKIAKLWTIRINRNYMYKAEVKHIYHGIKQQAYFRYYADFIAKS